MKKQFELIADRCFIFKYFCWFRKKLQMQGAQKLRSETHYRVRRNDEVEEQHRRWTFYETSFFPVDPRTIRLASNTYCWGAWDSPRIFSINILAAIRPIS